jgi:NIPSNAP
VNYQLREYTVKPGEMEQWIKEWREKIVPLRVSVGFQVIGAWTIDGTDQFVWIVGYGGPKAWEQAEKDYYESPGRKALDPDPARHLAHHEARRMSEVPMQTG